MHSGAESNKTVLILWPLSNERNCLVSFDLNVRIYSKTCNIISIVVYVFEINFFFLFFSLGFCLTLISCSLAPEQSHYKLQSQH